MDTLPSDGGLRAMLNEYSGLEAEGVLVRPGRPNADNAAMAL